MLMPTPHTCKVFTLFINKYFKGPDYITVFVLLILFQSLFHHLLPLSYIVVPIFVTMKSLEGVTTHSMSHYPSDLLLG